VGIKKVAGPADLTAAARAVVDITVADEVVDYVMALAAETRRSPSLTLGVSPRGAAMLLVAAKARAYLARNEFVTPDDVKAVLKPAWRHRIVLRAEVELEGATADTILDQILARVAVPR